MIERSDTPDLGWDSRLSTSPSGNYHQSTHLAAYYRCLSLVRPHFFVARDSSGQTSGQLLLLEGRRGGARIAGLDARLRDVLGMTLRLSPAFYFWAHGPIVFGPDPEPYQQLVLAALDFARKQRAASISGYPSVYGPNREREAEWFGTAAARGGAEVAHLATYVLSLSASEEDLWKGVRPEARTKVRRAERDGIAIRPCETERDFAQFVRIVEATSRRLGKRDPHLKRRWTCSWNVTRPRGTSHFFLSTSRSVAVSAQHASLWNEIAILSGVSYTDEARELRLYGNDLMQWHLIRWAKRNGARTIDWVGASHQASASGVDAFKAKWGGDHVTYPVLHEGSPIDAARVATR